MREVITLRCPHQRCRAVSDAGATTTVRPDDQHRSSKAFDSSHALTLPGEREGQRSLDSGLAARAALV